MILPADEQALREIEMNARRIQEINDLLGKK
jgi:hypothetical protein